MMRSHERFFLCFLTAAAALVATLPPPAAHASEQPVTLAEVSVNAKATVVVAGDVREIAESAIVRTTWPSGRRDSLVSVSVVSMDSRPSQTGSSLTCLVSAALRDKRTGAVYAVVESRATREQKSVTAADERATVSVALENAISRLPSALR
jgi:hypothetical protein